MRVLRRERRGVVGRMAGVGWECEVRCWWRVLDEIDLVESCSAYPS